MSLSGKDVLKEVSNFVFITIGLALFAFGWTAFMIPHELTGGGVSGIGAILYFALKIPVGVTTLVLNLILVAVAWRVLGRKFCINTIICSVILSAFMTIGQAVFTQPLVDDKFMCTLIGASLAAFGVSPLQYSCLKIPWTKEPGGL